MESGVKRVSGRSILADRIVAVVGAGPAGLMAAETIAGAGIPVEVFDAMPSVGRKFLLAGRGGLNLTHSEPLAAFLTRYGERRDRIAPMLDAFSPQALRDWACLLGIETFVGSSGRVFPKEMKAAPLLRHWLHRLRAGGVNFSMRHRWTGWHDTAGQSTKPVPALRFDTPEGERIVEPGAVVFALGGASWARLGSDGAWIGPLGEIGVPIAPLRPANCGFDVGATGGRETAGWSKHFVERFAGKPAKTIAARLAGSPSGRPWRTGEFVITETGVEGTLIYALSAELRDAIDERGPVVVELDLAPGRSVERLAAELARARSGRSFANHLRVRAGIEGTKAALLRELLGSEALLTIAEDPIRLAGAIKRLPLLLLAARPIDEAISTAGGVRFEALDGTLMLRSHPGIFFAGEMLDWEAPTGGYLLTACMASGRVAGTGVLQHLRPRARAERRDPEATPF